MEKLISWRLLFCWLSVLLLFPLSATGGSEFIAVAYHDVVDQRNKLTYDGVTLDNLIDHLEWLKISGYNPISIDDLQAAREGSRPLPEKAILLCWDDAYTSFYTHVFPLLKAYNYPAVLALVGSWMAPGPDEMVLYGDKTVNRNTFMTWKQIKEVAASGLVEIASHSFNLHTAVLADQAGDTLPAAVAHIFDPGSGTYESEVQFKQRIRNDLQASSDLHLQHLGFRPRILVWPFGRYNAAAKEIAGEIGMDITLTLNPVPADTDHLQAMGRFYPTKNPNLGIFRSDVESTIRPPVNHFFRVNSNDLLEAAAGEETRFGAYLDRVKALDPDMVIIDPVVEVDGRKQALFVNSRMPVAQDRLQRLSWHTNKRAFANVFLWLSPELFVPNEQETEETINRFFSDMGKAAPGRGVVVSHPQLVDALLELSRKRALSETETRFWNPDKQRWARQELLAASEHPQIRASLSALEAFQQWQPFQVVSLLLGLEQFQAMELHQFNKLLSLFDFLIIDLGSNSPATLHDPLGPQLAVLKQNGYLRKCAFLLSSDENADLAHDLRQLPTIDGINWGYQFDHFQENRPPLQDIRLLLSKKSFPLPLRY